MDYKCDCESLESIHLPNSIKIIGDKVFWFCKSLKSINIPDSVKKLTFKHSAIVNH